MVGTVNIYVIWYGNWTITQKAIIGDFLNNVGGSDWYQMNTPYYQIINGVKTNISPNLVYANSVIDNYSQGKNINSTTRIIQTQINNNFLPLDSNGIYFVLSSDDVNESVNKKNKFCVQYCGYHSVTSTRKSTFLVKFAFVGNSRRFCGGGCGVRSPSPNGDSGILRIYTLNFLILIIY
jgi:hypothetical protein